MRFLFLSATLLFSLSCLAQSDLLILKKNQRTHKTFFPGSEMVFSTAMGSFDAFVTSIQRDSIFLIQYDIRQVPTNLGVYVLDTVARYRFGINYHDITGFGKEHKNFDWHASGAALFGGGVLLTTVGLGTWIFSKPNTRYYARPSLVIGSAALAGVGYLLLRSNSKGIKLGKKYSLTYIKVK
jgi:hypothetical protein